MGKGWLVNDMISATLGISFDAVRATYSTETLDVDAWWSKLAENSPIEQDGDVDFYGRVCYVQGYQGAEFVGRIGVSFATPAPLATPILRG